MSLRVTHIHRATHRADLFHGADRTLIFLALAVCALLFITFIPPCMIASPVMFFTAHRLLMRMAKADPIMRRVYWANLFYARHYPARSTPYCRRSAYFPKGWF